MSGSDTPPLSLIVAVLLGIVAFGALVAGSFEYVVFFAALAVISAVVAYTDFGGTG